MEFDYIIVGGGSAGCVLAARLSEDPSVTVALIEAGGNNDRVLNRVPTGAALHIVRRNECNWAFSTVPQRGLGGRRGYQPRGRGLGGSSTLNAMIYLRGQREDYDGWAADGAPGWSWNDVLPYFIKAENNERGGNSIHGNAGPLQVADLRSPHPAAALFIEAGQQAGLPRNDDFAGHTQEGVGWYQVTQKDGERWSAASAYLAPARQRPNLHVVTDALATQIIVEARRAVGIKFRQGNVERDLRARREVLVAAGALQSPQLLMVSGYRAGGAFARAWHRADSRSAGREQPARSSGYHDQSSRREHRSVGVFIRRRHQAAASDKTLATRAAWRAYLKLCGSGSVHSHAAGT